MDISRKVCLLVFYLDCYISFKKNRAILVQKLGTEKNLSKSVSGYKKSSMAIKPAGVGWEGGKALMARP